MLTFVALPKRGSMAIYNARQTFNISSVLPVSDREIEIIGWTGKEGFFEYSDGLRITEEFFDPAPYGPLIDAWLNAAVEQLTLTQAKRVKKDFIEAIFMGRRRSPYDSYLGRRWKTTEDDLTAAMAMLVPQLVGTSTTGLIADINRAIGQFNAIDTAFYNHYPSFAGLRWSGWTGQTSTLPSGGGGHGNTVTCEPMFAFQPYNAAATYSSFTIWHASPQTYAPAVGWYGVGRESGAPGSYLPAYNGAVAGVSAPGGGAGIVPWESVSPSQAKHMLTAAQAGELLQLISDRNNWHLDRKMERLNQVDAMTTMAQVIAYDVTAGW